jgi:hypothetical protein
MQMISNTADKQRFCVQVTADRRNVGVHTRSNIAVQPWFAILGAEDNVKDDLAKRLGHCGIIAEKRGHVNRAVSANEFFYPGPGALPQAGINIAPLALTDSNAADYIKRRLWRTLVRFLSSSTEVTGRMYFAPRALFHLSPGNVHVFIVAIYVFSAKGAGSFQPGATPQVRIIFSKPALKARINRKQLPYRFFFAQAPTRSSAFSMLSIELATLKRK